MTRFGHNPDPSIDYCVEVDELERMLIRIRLGHETYPEFRKRVNEALSFRFGTCKFSRDARRRLKTLADSIEPATKRRTNDALSRN
jgi:hypothetical protein